MPRHSDSTRQSFEQNSPKNPERAVVTYCPGLVWRCRRAVTAPLITAGYELARHIWDFLSDEGDDADEAYTHLEHLLRGGSRDDVMAWYRERFPAVFAGLRTCQRRGMVEGILRAADDGVMEGILF